jgi:hypothetical protein
MLLRLLVALAVVGMVLLREESQAMWAKLDDAELITQSSVIVMAELLGETQITLPPQRTALRLGVLQVMENLRGTGLPSLLLLVLPSAEGPRSSRTSPIRRGNAAYGSCVPSCLRETVSIWPIIRNVFCLLARRQTTLPPYATP